MLLGGGGVWICASSFWELRELFLRQSLGVVQDQNTRRFFSVCVTRKPLLPQQRAAEVDRSVRRVSAEDSSLLPFTACLELFHPESIQPAQGPVFEPAAFDRLLLGDLGDQPCRGFCSLQPGKEELKEFVWGLGG